MNKLKRLFRHFSLIFLKFKYHLIYEKMKKLFSKEMVYPKFQMVFVDLKTNLKHQTKLYYEYVKYFLRS
jgi:hypothetical protein